MGKLGIAAQQAGAPLRHRAAQGIAHFAIQPTSAESRWS